MMRNKNTKTMVRSPNVDTNFFDIAGWVLLGDILAPFTFLNS